MFDRSVLPENSKSIFFLEELEDIINKLHDQVIEEIKIPDADSGFRVPNLMRVQSQCFTLRSLELANSIITLANNENWLSIVIIGRSLVEIISAHSHFKNTLNKLTNEGDIQGIHDFTCGVSFGTRLKHLIKKINDPNIIVEQILNQIDKFRTPVGGKIRNDYDHLSEYCHPNSFGTYSFFGKHDHEADIFYFNKKGHYPEEAFFWGTFALHLLIQTHSFSEEVELLAQNVSDIESNNR